MGASADLDAALDGVGLTVLVEGHHDDGCTVVTADPSLLEEFGLTSLQRDRIHDGFALQAGQSGLDDLEP